MPDYSHLTGWKNRPKEVEGVMQDLPMPIFEDVYGNLKDTGKGKTVLLYTYLQKLYPNFVQVQNIGDCVSFSSAHCIDTLKAVEIELLGELEQFINITATEFGYGGSRVLIGGGRLGNSDGSIGAWISELINTYGSLDRGKYGDIDLTTYSGTRARDWGYKGPPKSLLPYASKHIVKTVSQVSSYNAARDAIANGYPVSVCSNIGFNSVRDKHGMLRATGTWNHAQAILAVDDAYTIPSMLIQNSWPYNWVSGPLRYGNEPQGSYWCDAQTIDRMLKQGDSFVYSNFAGYEVQNLDLRIV